MNRPSLVVPMLIVAACWLGHSGRTAAGQPPNLFLVIADDQTWFDSGAYGNADVKTPNIDRLARQGKRFTHCFTATAMCAPTRQQLYTGLFPVRNGAYPNHSLVYPGTRSIVHHLSELGYRVGLCGKKHFGPPESFPFEDLKSGQLTAFIARDEQQPYCLIYASHSPHLPWSEGDAAAYDPEELSVPPHLLDVPATRKAMAKYYAEITDLDREVGQCMKLVEDSAQRDNTLFLYTSEQGAQFPRCKWTCYDTGLRTALVIRWPGVVAAGSVSDAMVQYVDILPTLIEAAGGDPSRIDTGRRGGPEGSQGFDGRSFLEVLRGDRDRHRDLVYGCQTTLGIINGSECYPVRCVRSETYKLIWNLNFTSKFRNVVIGGRDRGGYWNAWVEQAKTDKQAAWRIRSYQQRPEWELYDLTEDPFELHNLAEDPAHADLREQLRVELVRWMEQQGDEGIQTELQAKSRQRKKRASNDSGR